MLDLILAGLHQTQPTFIGAQKHTFLAAALQPTRIDVINFARKIRADHRLAVVDTFGVATGFEAGYGLLTIHTFTAVESTFHQDLITLGGDALLTGRRSGVAALGVTESFFALKRMFQLSSGLRT